MRRWAILGAGVCFVISPAARAGTVVSETETEPYPGVRLVERIESNPNNRIHVAYISLCADGVHVVATAPPSSRRTTGSWAQSRGVQLAVNGDFFSGAQVYGDAVGDGMRWPTHLTGNGHPGDWYHGKYGWIAFGNGWVEFNHTQWTKTKHADRFNISQGWYPRTVTTEIPEGTMSLVSGFPELVIEGQPFTCPSPTHDSCFTDRTDMRQRNPRTAMGITEDRRAFILAVVDGRDSPSSVGMYGAELARLMADLGAWQAFNLDGGGSTSMWLEGEGYVNEPSDGSARAVANHWGIFAGAAGGQSSTPGSCFVPGGCHPTVLPGAEDQPFADMPPQSFGHDAAIALLESGTVEGCTLEPERMFCPRCGLNRVQAARFFVGALELDVSSPPTTASFVDVTPGTPGYAEIEAVVAAGIMEGCNQTSFCPGGSVARGAFAGMLRAAMDWDVVPSTIASFADVGTGEPWFLDVETLAAHCVAEACEEGKFCPEQALDRVSAAVMLTRAVGLIDGACELAGGDDGGFETAGGQEGGAGDGSQGTGATAGTTGLLPPASSWGQRGAGDTGCSCRTGPSGPEPFGWAVALLALLGRRRTRRRHRHR